MVRCSGCNADFVGKAYTLHLRKTPNPACKAIFEESNSAGLASSTVDAQAHDAQFGDADNDGCPIGNTAFEGDYFGDAGDYDEEDFGYKDSDDEGDNPPGSEGDAEEDEEDEDDNDLPAQAGYEPYRAPIDPESDIHMSDPESRASSSSTTAVPSCQVRKAAEDCFHRKPIIEHYPGSRAGKPIAPRLGKTAEEEYESSLLESTSGNPYAPFKSKMDWEVAKWARLRGSGSTAFTDLLKVEGVRSALDLSYANSVQLNKIIDEKLPGCPKFTRSEVVVNGEVFSLYSRDILECVRALWGDTSFAPYLFVAPERHYIDKDKTIRMYHNMHTGKWWWSTQEAVEKDHPGATIIPIIISSDKTQLTMFGNKTAYPVYMSIGNIPKEIRRKPSLVTSSSAICRPRV
ncbi:hypothetical protein B0H13DRAFT_2305169 [Mycena leptocephala]|nr:hypothetical protein B0H13DRAFT_2305169 [Mycena leptocephala]